MDPAALSEIARKLRDKDLILFVGSGMSAPYFPTWGDLLKQLQTKAFDGDPEGATEVARMIEDKQYLNAAWAIQYKAGDAWRKHIEATFKGNPSDHGPIKRAVERKYAALKGLDFASVVTTNYDDFLVGVLGTSAITHEDADQIAAMPRTYQLLKLHGNATNRNSLILTSTDFSKMKLGRDAIDEFMHTAAKHYSFLFIGYSFEDEDVLWWLERACYKTQGNVKGHFGLVDGSKWGPYKRKLYQQRYGIQMVDAKLDASGYPDIEAFLHQLQAAYKQAQAAPVAELFKRPQEWPEAVEYVDPEILARKDKSIHGLDSYLIEWLKAEDGSRQLLVLLGEFGTGKTQFSYRAEQLVRDHSKRTPVLVKLGQFHKGADPAKISAVAAPGAEQRFLNANRDGTLVLILDAFDEMGKATAAQSLNDSFEKLTSDLVHGNAKVILTCRKELFREEGDVDRLAYGRPIEDRSPADKVIAKDAEKVEVQLFDETRIQRALVLRNRTEVFEQIRGNERVADLARRPVLLDLIAQYNRPFDANTKLADLYEKYIDKMLERGPDDRHAYDRREFANKIAWTMQNSGPMPASELEKPLKEMGFEAEADRFRSRSLLVRQVNDYVFGHASFREYLVAKQVVPLLKENNFVECKLSDPAIAFIREMWTWTPPQPAEKEGMVWIPPGPFIYGDAATARIANLEKGLWIDKYPVTNQQYLDFLLSVGKDGLFKPKFNKKWINHKASRITGELTLPDPKWSDHPVVGVSWFGAKAYAEATGKRLCTEEEWEKAARGIDGREYPWGDGFDPSKANTNQSQIRGTTAVTAYAGGASANGVFDMAGNVFEWTASGSDTAKVLRGGCWYDSPGFARCAVRLRGDPEFTGSGIGFRCART